MKKIEHNTMKAPIEIKKLRGTVRNDRMAIEPVKFDVLENMPEPPKYFKDVARKEWYRILEQYKAIKIFSVLDIPSIIIYCKAWDDYNRICVGLEDGSIQEIVTFENGTQQVSPYMTLLQRSIDTIKAYGERLGVTPVSRTKVSGLIGGKKDDKDPFGEMFDKKKAQ